MPEPLLIARRHTTGVAADLSNVLVSIFPAPSVDWICLFKRPDNYRDRGGVAERKGVTDARMQEFRWLLEELRVSFFAQELRTPQPVSVKRLDKAWQQLSY